MKRLRHILGVTAAVVSTGLLLSACATEEYVDEHVGAVNSRVDALTGRVDQNASQIQALNGTIQEVGKNAQETSGRLGEHINAQGAASQVISTDDSTQFETGKWALSDEDQVSLTALAQKILSDNQDVYLEIHGHADSRGGKHPNRVLGAKRAEATREFLAGQGVPLHRMSITTYGEDKPLGPNDTAEGQSQNRRVTIVIRSN